MIVDIAKGYLGQRGHSRHHGFEDEQFEKRMLEIGWIPPLRWCCYFAKLVWLEYYKDDPILTTILNDLFGRTVVDSFYKFDKNEMFTISNTPVVGSVGFFEWTGRREGKDSGTTLLVTEVGDKYYSTLEIHNKKGVLEVVESKRKLHRKVVDVGLNLLGFIHPL